MSDDDNIDSDKMRNALSAIAKEIQQNFNTTSVTTDEHSNAELLKTLIKYKSALNLKNLQIKQLKSNLKTACDLRKTLALAKATEIASLSKHLEYTRNQYLNSEKQHSEKKQIINNLSKENHTLRGQLEFFSIAIQLCYRQLQGVQNEHLQNVSTPEQLKYIIVCCGQYHSDYCNEHERCIRLQQKNRFLSTKMIIMENNLEAVRDELRTLRTFIKPYKEKRDASARPRHCLGVVCSDYKLGSHQRNFTKLTVTKIELARCSSLVNIRDLDLTNHLKTVKKLLNENDDLIKDLKNLSREINDDES